MKKTLLASLCVAVCFGGLVWWHHASAPRDGLPLAAAASSNAVVPQVNVVGSSNVPLPSANAVLGTKAQISREMDLTVNPYAAGLREPGKSKREWDARFIESFQQAKAGDPVRFELTQGAMAEGVVKSIQREGGTVSYVSGELTVPENGSFFILRPPDGGKAGKAAAVIQFPGSATAYRVEPTGANGDPELWQRRLDEVICVNMVKMEAAATNNAANGAGKEPLNPGDASGSYPSYNVNIEGTKIISLQSLPGSSAVLLLDFFGRDNVDLNYLAPHVSNAQIKDVWKRVAEDYMPFNVNVTTDIRVFLNAPRIGKVRIAITPSFAGAGVAGIGAWNLADEYGVHAWSGYVSGKAGAEVCAHEVGHTLGLGHQGLTTTPGGGYYGGQGSGETGWAPIMGVGYYQPLSTWSKGEYTDANNLTDELLTISTANNNVAYRTDDTGSTLAASRYLEIYTNNTVFAEGVISYTADTDAFQFTTTGGVVSLTARPVAVGDWANLATLATLADATDTVIASNNVQSLVSSTITTNLAAGTYTFRVTGAGKNNPLTDGFSSYASLGYYSITGSVAGARMPTRLSVAERATNNTVVGPVVAVNPNSSPLAYAITAGNTGTTFSVDNSGVVRVASNALLDYYKLATNWNTYVVQFEVFMNITNVNNPALTELNRRVVIAVQPLYPPVPAYVTATVDTSLRIDLSWMGGQAATSYNVKRSTTNLGPYTTVATPTDMSYTDSGLSNGVTYYYVISAVNTNGESANSAQASATAQAVAGFGFETPSIGSGNYSYNPSGGFWTFSAQNGDNGSGIVANGSGFSNPNAPEGTQAAFVQSYGTITQTLAGFTPGTNYTITYSAAQRSGASQHGGESWNVVIDGSVIKTNNPGPTSYTTYTATFTATATTHTLSFVGTDLVGGDNTVFIDNVRFSPVLKPVPAAVALTSPVNNAAIAASAPVNLTATVTTNGNVINGVQFYSDTITLLGQITNAPYTLAWANVSAGARTVFARVLFNNGSSADSAPINFTVVNQNMNLGFEIPSLGGGNYAYNPGGASWTFVDSDGASGSGIAANGSAFGNPNAPQGTQSALLQGYGSISQTLAGFVPGTNYTISYSAAQRSTVQNGGESWDVVIDNVVIKTNNPGSTSYSAYTASFTATATSHTLSFVGTDLAGGDNTVFIDNVSFSPPLVTLPTPSLTTNTLPATAVDSVGNTITFQAGFNSTNPVAYQWQKITGGLLSDISGATNTTLTLTNLQLGDAASYRLQASNGFGVSVSTASPLTVSNTPAAVSNVIATYAAQTGLGTTLVNFTPSWSVALGSMILGQSPSSVGSGNFSQSTSFLTDGSFGYFSYIPGVGLSPTEVTGGSSAGQSVIYNLGGSASGYSISNIVVYGGWGDAGRDQQAYTVSYSSVAAPTNFISLASVDFNPANPSAVQSATRSSLKSATGGPLATNVAALKFDFTTPSPENGYCGYSEIAVYGTSINPAVTQNTLPVTAADVVGSQVTFTAAFTGVEPLFYQWQKVSGGVTNNVVGATNTILTLTNLQLANTASYQLQASNAYAVAVSAARALTVSSVPGAVNNVVTSMAAQTGTGSGTFTPTWTVVTNNSLIAGKSPSSTSGSFTLEVPGRSVNFMTDGGDGALTQINGPNGTTTSANYVTCGNGGGAGALVTFTLTGFAAGYTLTNITVYAGWKDAGRDQQAYTVYYSKVAAPTTFLSLGSVNYNPANLAGAQSATRATLAPANGVLATNVAAVKFDFTTPASENGYVGYTEIALFGIPTQVVANNPTNITFQVTGNNLTLNWPADHLGWRLQVQTNSLAQGLRTNWFGVAGSTSTNQMSIPINATDGSVFYRLSYP